MREIKNNVTIRENIALDLPFKFISNIQPISDILQRNDKLMSKTIYPLHNHKSSIIHNVMFDISNNDPNLKFIFFLISSVLGFILSLIFEITRLVICNRTSNKNAQYFSFFVIIFTNVSD